MAESEYTDVPGQIEMDLTEAHTDQPVVFSEDEQAAMYKQLLQELDKVKQSNLAKFAALEQGGVKPDPFTILLIRVGVLANIVLDQFGKSAFELAFERSMVQVLDACLAEMRHQEITRSAGIKSGKSPGGLYVAGR